LKGIFELNFKILIKLFTVFLKIGAFTFGGGYAMLPLIQKEAVDRQKWLKDEEILDIFAISQSIPGVIALNSAIFIGKRVAGTVGAIFSALGIILPSFLVILVIASLLVTVRDNIILDKFFAGIRASSTALILLAAIKMVKTGVKHKWGIAVALISFLMIVVFDIHALWAVTMGGISGIALYFLKRRPED